jgi:hypothetical protein
MHNSDPTSQGVENRNILLCLKCVINPLTRTGRTCTLEWTSVVIKDHERDPKVLKNFKVYFKRGWNKSPFDIKSLYFILTILITEDDHNQIVFNNCNSAVFLHNL